MTPFVKPSVTQRAALDATVAVAPDTSFMEVSELRTEVGLFSDTSQDDVLTEYLLFAIEKMEEYVGQTLIARKTTDKYPAGLGRFAVSSKGVRGEAGEGVEVWVWTTIGRKQLDAADWYLDPTPTPAHVVIEGGMVADAQRYALPVEISYTAGVGERSPAASEQLRQAIRYIVGVLYESRGTSNLPPRWDQGIGTILGLKHTLSV